MCGNISEHLLQDVSICVASSVQLDESIDIRNTVQLLVFIRMVFQEFSFKEELLGMIYSK
jgi:hypothetical protein